MAHIYFEERFPLGPRGGTNIDAVFRGAVWADLAAELGFVPPVVLSIAQIVERLGFRRQEEYPLGYAVDRFVALKELWRVFDTRKAEVEKHESVRDAKVTAKPNLYFCAAPGCAIEATHKSGLMKCSGKCKLEGKPSYCSKECQKAVCPRAF
jgi:hypothetical protein